MKRLFFLIFLTGCVVTEINYEPIPPIERKQKSHKDFDSTVIDIKIDSTLNEDTTRVLIEFNPSVEDWEEN